MVHLTTLALVAASAASAVARVCQNLTIPLTISARNAQFNFTAPSSNIGVTDFILNYLRPQGNLITEIYTGAKRVAGNYSIGATYCTPDTGPGKALQILTHGVGFDRSYWDFPINDYNYSYMNAAVARGYSTFSFDRLGIGQSSHGEPVNEIQSALEVAALRALTTGLRDVTLPGITDRYNKTFHVGHSYGSIQTFGLTAQVAAECNSENISDGIVLTGLSYTGEGLPYFLYGGNFVSASSIEALADSYVDGYFAAGSQSAVQTNFFAPGMFDPAVLAAATEMGQPVTVGELLTLTAPLAQNGYAGPVLVVTGDRDLPFCGGNCSTEIPPLPFNLRRALMNSSHFEYSVIPGAGHGLNLEYSFPLTYEIIHDYFDKYASS